MENFHKFTQYTQFLSITKMTSLAWTIYSWKAFNSLGSPLLLRTNNRCVASLNISVEVAKCGKFSQIHLEHSHLSVTKNDLSRLNNLFMVSFQLIRMSSYAKNKQQIVESLNISVEVAICGKYSQIHPTHSLFVCDKEWLVLPKQSIHGKL